MIAGTRLMLFRDKDYACMNTQWQAAAAAAMPVGVALHFVYNRKPINTRGWLQGRAAVIINSLSCSSSSEPQPAHDTANGSVLVQTGKAGVG